MSRSDYCHGPVSERPATLPSYRSRLTCRPGMTALNKLTACGVLVLAIVCNICKAAGATDLSPDLEWTQPANAAPFAAREPGSVRRTPLEFAAIRPAPAEFEPRQADIDDRALIRAAGAGKLDRVKSLLQAGVNANAGDVWGERPLCAAVRAGHAEIVRLLLERGADPDVRGPDGLTPLGSAALAGHAGIARRLLRAGAAVDLKSANGNTPLLNAVQMDRVAVAEVLLAQRPDLEIPNRDGLPPLLLAAREGHLALVKLLITHGADPNLAVASGETTGGGTALWWAVYRRHRLVVTTLLDQGAVPGAMSVDIY